MEFNSLPSSATYLVLSYYFIFKFKLEMKQGREENAFSVLPNFATFQ